ELVLVAHGDGHLHETDPVAVLHVPGVGMVPVLRVVATHEQEVREAERARPEQVGLQRDAVPIAPRDLDDRLDAGLTDEQRRRDRGHRRDAAVAVRDVDGVDAPFEQAGASFDDLAGRALGRIELGGHDELTLPEERCQVAQIKTTSPYSREVALYGSTLSHLSLFVRAGVGTVAGLRWLPRRHRAVPSASSG